MLLFGTVYGIIITVVLCLQAYLFFVMELAHGGNLRDQLDQVENFSEPTATFYAAEIAVALQFLHAKGIVHRYVTFNLQYAVVIEMISIRLA